MSRFKVVFFDAAGTLFHVRGSVGEVYLRHAERYGVTRSPQTLDAVNAAFASAFRDAPPPIFAVSDPAEIRRCERLWWFDIVHNVFYRVGMFEGFDDYFDEVFQAFAGSDQWTLYSDTLRTLKELKDAGVELGVVSNFDTRLFGLLRGLGLADLFDTVTISSLAHSAKPAPQIFRQAIEKHTVDPEEALHVGDSLRDDVEGAIAAGLSGVWLNRDERAAGTTSSSPHKTITSLEQLPPLLAAI